MYFVDVNTMVGDWLNVSLHFKAVPELLEEMKRINISRSLVFGSGAWLYDPKAGNAFLLEAIKGHDELIPVIVLTSLLDEEFGGWEKVSRYITENRIGAVRLFPSDQNYTLNSWNTDKLFSLLNKLRIPVLLEGREQHGGLEKNFSNIFEAASTYKDIPFIMLTIGYRNLRIIYDLFRKCPNIHIDTSTFITYRGIEDVVKHFGSERILFGSRMPFLEAGVSAGRIIYAEISQQDKENIAHGNIERLLANIQYNASGEGGCCR